MKQCTILTAISSNGLISNWHLATNKVMNDISDHVESKNALYAADYFSNGKRYAVGGTDRKIYVYDSATKELSCTMHNRGLKVPGHINRIYSLKAHPTEKNLLVSAGWDGMVKIYDIRDKAPVASMGGSLVSGDAIDVYDDMIIAGSYRNKDVMQMYSLSQQKRVHNFEFNQSGNKDLDSGFIFSTKFSNDGNFIIAGGAGKNELKVFNNNADSNADFKIQMEIREMPMPVNTIAVNPNSTMK
jgi:WD40 repeat protein